MHVRLSSRAEREMDVAEIWWRKHRHKAPNALRDDVAEALRLVRREPLIGRPWQSRRGRWMRRLYLKRVHYHLYYRVEGDRITILSLWHASRRPPSL